MHDFKVDTGSSLLELFAFITQDIQPLNQSPPQTFDPAPESKTTICFEAAVQCNTEQEEKAKQIKDLQRLTQLLILREEQGVGLHLAAQDKENELSQLRQRLQSKEEEISRLNARLNKIETEAALRQMMMQQMQSQLHCAWNKEFQNQQKYTEKQQDGKGVKEENQQQIVILPNEQAIIQQKFSKPQREVIHILSSLTESAKYTQIIEAKSEEIDKLNSQIQKIRAQKQELKGMQNNFEWKHFCLESQLELARKEKQELKISCDKLESRLTQYEGMIHDQMVNIYSLKEKNQWLSEDNIEMIQQMRKKQRDIFRLMDEQDNIKQYAKEESKQLKYRIREKEEEFKEVTDCLKLKIMEVDQCKRRCQLLEKEKLQMQYKLEYSQLQNYDLEQSIIEHQQIMEKQSQKIEEFTRNTDFFNKKLQEECMLKIIRTREWDEKYRTLQHIIKQKNQKIQQISAEVLHRETESNRTIEELHRVTIDADLCRETLKQNDTLKGKLQAQINQLEITSSIKDRTIEEYEKQLDHIKQQYAKKQQQILALMSQLDQQEQKRSWFENENTFLQHNVKQMEDTIEEMKIQMSTLEDHVKNSVQNETNLQLKYEESNKFIQQITCQKKQFLARENQLSRQIETIRSEIKSMHSNIKQKIQSIVDNLQEPEAKDETIYFQVLQDNENYQIIESEENKIKKIKHNIQQFLSQMCTITAKYL